MSVVFENYGRYWLELFRLGAEDARRARGATSTCDGFEHVDAAHRGGPGRRSSRSRTSGNWDFAGAWLAGRGPAASGRGRAGRAARAVRLVRRRHAARLGMDVIPLGPDAGAAVLRALAARPGRVPGLRPRPHRRRCRRSSSSASGPRCPAVPPRSRCARGAPLLPVGDVLPARVAHRVRIDAPIAVERTGTLPRRRGPRHPGARAPLRGAHPARRPEQWLADAAELAVRRRPPARMPRRDRRRRDRDALRVALICPYSLSVDGGVQVQVLGLARGAARASASTRACSRPSDGPPPEPGITSLGPTRRFPSNGSIAPIAVGQGRRRADARGAARVPSPTCVHLHEPLSAGRQPRGAPRHRHPRGRHVPRRAPGAQRVVRRVPHAARAMVDRARGAHRRLGGGAAQRRGGVRRYAARSCRTASTSRRSRARRRGRRRGPAILFVGRHEPPQGPRRAARRVRRRSTATPSSGSRATDRRPQALPRREVPGVEWLGPDLRGREGAPAARGDRRVLPVDRGRVVRRRAARGDGRGTPRSSRPTSPATAHVARRGPRGAPGRARRRRPRCAAALRRVLDDAALRGRPGRRPGPRGPPSSR